MKIIITLILFLFPIQEVLAAAAAESSVLEDDISDTGMSDRSCVPVPLSAGVSDILILVLDTRVQGGSHRI